MVSGPPGVEDRVAIMGALSICAEDKMCGVGKLRAVESLSAVNKVCVVVDKVPVVG
jgi:hypothetical protein